MTSEPSGKTARPTGALARPVGRISLLTAVSVVVANMVGTGIFTSLGFQVVSLSSGFVLLVLWVVGGVCAFCGALAYAELGAALPRSGGEYALLTRIISPPAGFLAGWVSMIAGFPAAVALSALAFGRYLHGLSPSVPPLATGIVMLLAVTAVHWSGLRLGSRFQVTTTMINIATIVVIVTAGLFVPWHGTVSFTPTRDDLGTLFGAPFAISLVFVMFTYSGWNAATYISGEVAEPERNVPRAVATGTGIVFMLYLALNAFFLLSTPREAMKGQVEVALVAARTAFGPVGGSAMGLVIAVLLVSSVSSMVWAGTRVTVAVGEDFPRLAFFSRRSEGGSPRPAIALQTLVTLLMMATGTFESVLIFLQFTLLLSSFVTVMGVYILRWREPDLPRPYRAWGYPVTPAVFMACSLWMMVFVALQRPTESILGILSLLAGLLAYFAAGRGGGSAGRAGTEGPGTNQAFTESH